MVRSDLRFGVPRFISTTFTPDKMEVSHSVRISTVLEFVALSMLFSMVCAYTSPVVGMFAWRTALVHPILNIKTAIGAVVSSD